MSWLSDAANSLGSVFGEDDLGDTIATFFEPGPGGGVVPAKNTQEGGGLWSSQFLGSALNAGLGLAGTYFKTSQDKKLAEEYAKQKLAEIEAAKKAGGGGGGAGAALKIAKMNNLSALYQNWAALAQKGGENMSAATLATGKMMQDPINVRLARL